MSTIPYDEQRCPHGVRVDCEDCWEQRRTGGERLALRALLKATRLLWDHRMNPAKLRPEVIQGAIEQAEAALLASDRAAVLPQEAGAPRCTHPNWLPPVAGMGAQLFVCEQCGEERLASELPADVGATPTVGVAEDAPVSGQPTPTAGPCAPSEAAPREPSDEAVIAFCNAMEEWYTTPREVGGNSRVAFALRAAYAIDGVSGSPGVREAPPMTDAQCDAIYQKPEVAAALTTWEVANADDAQGMEDFVSATRALIRAIGAASRPEGDREAPPHFTSGDLVGVANIIAACATYPSVEACARAALACAVRDGLVGSRPEGDGAV